MTGRTYFRWWGFSINEGEFPNIHISWWDRYLHFYIYIALSNKYRFCWSLKLGRIRT